ncbi:MAG TPA: L-2-amino-thiazoline-4-carboxylic acid hydrolase [Bacillota bacterium]|nr:L-2-amino-thiazoline-4-carboxylic acid hydrolase [Bacillota bacterium]
MDTEKRVQILELAYAGALVDSVRWLKNEGILEKVTEQKKKEQFAIGKQQAERFGIQKPEEVFLKLSEIFNCASWEILNREEGFTAESKVCTLCALAKRMGTDSPCRIYCLNPMEGMVKGIDPAKEFNVEETLWDGGKCSIEVK